MNRKTRIRIHAAFLLSVLLLGPTAQATITRIGDTSTNNLAAAAPSPNLRIVGPAGEDPPVVNERKKLKLRVVDETDTDIPVTSWKTGSPSIAKVTKKGVLKGKLYGFVTVTAVTGRGEAATTAVVARVTRRHGSMGDGDTKSDSAGRIYLTSPDEQVIYRSDGVRDEIFAGAKGQAGYQDGTGQSARFHYPTGLGVDVSTNGGLYVADTDNHCVRKVGFDGRTSVAIGIPQFAGRIDADVIPADEAAFDSPKGVAAVGSALFVADTRNHALYYLNGGGDAVSLLAGQPGVLGFRNGLFREASFNLPSGLAINTEGNLLAVADTGNHAVRLVRIEAGGSPYLGRVSTAGVASKSRRGVPGAGFIFSAPTSVAFDSAQNVCVVDSQGAFVITRAADGTEAQVLLAQLGSLGRPASIVVSGTRAIIADADATSPGVAIAVVEVGAPRITGVTPSRLPEGATLSEVVIEGENFPPEARVVVDGQLIDNVRVESASRIVLDLPELARGARLVSVITRGGVAQREVDVVPPELDDLAPGEITTFAGTADPALGDGGRAIDAALDLTYAELGTVFGSGKVCLDGAGNLYLASPNSHRIRRVDAQSGLITTAVGTGRPMVASEGVPGPAFGLNNPVAATFGTDGALYVADTGHHRIVRVDPSSMEATTILGKAKVSGAGNDGDPAGFAFLLNFPTAIATDRAGNLYVSDAGNRRLLRVNASSNVVNVVAGGGPLDGLPADGEFATAGSYEVLSLALSTTGDIFAAVHDGPAGRIIRIGADKRIRTLTSGNNVALDNAGNVHYSHRGPGIVSAIIQRIDILTGQQTKLAGGGRHPNLGDSGPATEAYFEEGAITVDGTGNVFLVDSFHDRIRRVDSGKGVISTYAGSRSLRYSGDSGYRTSAAFSLLKDLAWDDGIGLCLADNANGAVRVVDRATGIVSTRAGGPPASTDPVEDGPAIGVRVTPQVVAITDSSNLYFGNSNAEFGRPGLIWAIESSGRLRREAGGGSSSENDVPSRDADFSTLRDMVVDANGDLVVSDPVSRRVRRIERATGLVRAVAGKVHDGTEYLGEGGPAVSAALVGPDSLAIAPNGDLFLVDGPRILRVDRSGTVTTVSGGPEFGPPVDGQTIASARFGAISGIAVDAAGDLYVADSGFHLVVRFKFSTGRVSIVTGLAGVKSNDGDGGAATFGSIDCPGEMAFDSDGNLYIASTESGVVRVVKRAGHTSGSR